MTLTTAAAAEDFLEIRTAAMLDILSSGLFVAAAPFAIAVVLRITEFQSIQLARRAAYA